MNNDPQSHGLWEASAPPAPPTSALVGDHVADVAIIGAGFTGCSAALYLAERGTRAVVLDAMDIGFGGSGRNVGLVNAGLWVMPDAVPDLLGPVFGERLLNQLGDAPRLVFDLVARHGIDCQPQQQGTLHCAVGAKGLEEIEARARQWQARGADVTVLDAGEASRMIGSAAYSGALLDHRAGTIQPLAYVRGLARAAIAAGAMVCTRSPVIAQDDNGATWTVHTTQGSVTAPWVIAATDAYSVGGLAPLRREQVMLPYFNMATRPLGHNLRKTVLPKLQGAWDTRQILSSFRLDRDGRLVLGSVGALRGTGTKVHGDWGRRTLDRLFPQLDGVAFEHAWYGMIGMTEDAVPRFHRLGRNVYSISGYNGRGIAPGTTFGRDLARLVLGDMHVDDFSLPLTNPAVAPMRAAKGAIYEWGAQAAHFVEHRF